MIRRLDTLIASLATPTWTAFRVVAGVMFTLYGTQKLLDWPVASAVPLAEAPWTVIVAGVVEIVCGPLIAVGLFARWAAFISSGQVAVAYFLVHWPIFHGEPKSFWPTVNNGERALLYCFGFLMIFAWGAGRWSLDARMGRSGAAHSSWSEPAR